MNRRSGIPGRLSKGKTFKSLSSISSFIQVAWKINPNGLIIEYSKLFTHLEKHHGLLYTLKTLKSYHGISQRYAAGQSFDRLSFTKVINKRSMLPLRLKAFLPFLEGTINERRVALTVLSIYRLISSKNDEVDYSQIEAPRNISRDFSDLNVNSDLSYLHRKVQEDPTPMNVKLLRSWRHCVNTMFPSSQLERRKERLQGNNLYISNKNGPNGPVLAGVPLDFKAMSSNGLINNVYDLSIDLQNQDLQSIIETMYQSDLVIHQEGDPIVASRLALKQEPGGKNRVFAIGDYFTQSALKSLHVYLFGLLRGLPEDGSHSHNYVSNICKGWSDCPDNRIYSIDLTGATNYIDCEVLGEIVQSIAGESYAKHWVNLMVGRKFKDIEGNERVYTVGQPMGFYSSWAMLAIWNHLMIRTCRHALSLSPSMDDPQFVIIGDDVAILGDDVAHMYLHLCKLMGVPTSPLKGFSPLTKVKGLNKINQASTMNSVEIAKRVFIDGLEMSGISPVEITEGMSLNYNFPSLLLSSAERGLEASIDENFVAVLARRTPNYKTSIDVALFPLNPALNWVKVSEDNKVIIDRCPDSFWNGIYYPVVSQLFYVYIKQRINQSVENFNKTIVSFKSSTPESIFTCRKYKYSSYAEACLMQLIARHATRMSRDILSRIKLVGDESSKLDNTLDAQVEKSRQVRRTIGLINAIFELETFQNFEEGNRFEDNKTRANRLITNVIMDIKAMYTI